jgi:hypothetical protein
MNNQKHKKKHYQLQKLTGYDAPQKLEVWKPVISSDDLITLMNFCPHSEFRILDAKNFNKVVYQPKEEDT